MNLQFFGGSGASSGRKAGGGGSTSLQPSPELLNRIRPDPNYAQNVLDKFDENVELCERVYGEIITEKDLKTIEKKMREMTNSDEVYVGVRFNANDLEKILADGRFKSQFETGTSNGLLNSSIRADAESILMGYSDSTSPKDRPVYGMLLDGKTPSDIPLSEARGAAYGNVVAIFKPSVKRHATVTMEDSIDDFGSILPSPLLRPFRYSISADYDKISEMNDLAKQRKIRPRDFELIKYAEVQIHGGQATTSNIDRLIFSKDTPKSEIPVEKLKSHGIKWEIEK